MPQNEIVKFKDAVQLLTVVTVSPKPINRFDLEDLPFVNEIFDNDLNISRHQAFINAIKKVQTPYVLFLNPEDKIKSDFVFPNLDKGIVFGNSLTTEVWGDQYNLLTGFSKDKNLENPYFIRRPILRTEFVEPILQITSKELLDTETVLYFIIAVVYGYQFDERLKITWNKKADTYFKDTLISLRDTTKNYLQNSFGLFKSLIDNYCFSVDKLALTPIEKFKNLITIITLSKTPVNRTDIFNLDYINHNAYINSEEKLFIAIKAAIRKVKTPYLIFVDDDDPVPVNIILPSDNVGMVYGDYFTQFGKRIDRNKSSEFSDEAYSKNVLMMHKPIFNTEKVKTVVEKLPILDNYAQSIIAYFVAKIYGAEYNKQLIVLWNKAPGNKLHRALKNNRESLFDFIKSNELTITESIKTIDSV